MPDLLLAPTWDAPTTIGEEGAGGGGGRVGAWWGWGLRRELWVVSSRRDVRDCGRAVISSDGRVRVVRVGNGAATRVHGVATCGSPWACPVCHLRWARTWVAELEVGSSLHLGAGGGLEFVTVTVPHGVDDPLASTWDRLHERRRSMLRQRWWRELCGEVSLVGQVTCQEVSVSPDGAWHPHLHLLAFTESPWSVPVRAAVFKRIGEWFRRRREVAPGPSSEGVGTLPPPEPGAGPGVDGGPVEEGSEGRVARYMAGGAAKGATQASAEGSLFGMVRSDPKRWREFEAASHGRQPLRWSPGLRERFGITGRSDRDPLPADHTVVRVLDRAEWRQVVETDGVGALRIAARGAVHQGA